MKNIKQFRQIIKIYESISLEEIKNSGEFIPQVGKFQSTSNKLTGFGRTNTCILCISAEYNLYDCKYCVYKGGCCSGELEESYNRIGDAGTPLELKDAFRHRAKVLREYAKNKNIKLWT